MSDSNSATLLTPAEAASYFKVNPKTVVRWSASGRFPAEHQGRPVIVRTGGGHHRFDLHAVQALASGELAWVATGGGDRRA